MTPLVAEIADVSAVAKVPLASVTVNVPKPPLHATQTSKRSAAIEGVKDSAAVLVFPATAMAPPSDDVPFSDQPVPNVTFGKLAATSAAVLLADAPVKNASHRLGIPAVFSNAFSWPGHDCAFVHLPDANADPDPGPVGVPDPAPAVVLSPTRAMMARCPAARFACTRGSAPNGPIGSGLGDRIPSRTRFSAPGPNIGIAQYSLAYTEIEAAEQMTEIAPVPTWLGAVSKYVPRPM